MRKFKILILTLNLLFCLNKFASATHEDENNITWNENLQNYYNNSPYQQNYAQEQQNLTENVNEINPNMAKNPLLNNWLMCDDDSCDENIYYLNNIFYNYHSNESNDIISKAKNLNKELVAAINKLTSAYNGAHKKKPSKKIQLQQITDEFLKVYNKALELWNKASEIKQKILDDCKNYANYKDNIVQKNTNTTNRYSFYTSTSFTANDKINLINLLQCYCLDLIKMGYILHYLNPLLQARNTVFKRILPNLTLENYGKYYKEFFKDYYDLIYKTFNFAIIMQTTKKKIINKFEPNKKLCFEDDQDNFNKNISKYCKNFSNFVDKTKQNFEDIFMEEQNLPDDIKPIKNISDVNKPTNTKYPKPPSNFKKCNFLILNLQILKDVLHYNDLKINQFNYSMKNESKKIKNNKTIEEIVKKNILEKYFNDLDIDYYKIRNNSFRSHLEYILGESQNENTLNNKKNYISIKSKNPIMKNQTKTPKVEISPNIEKIIETFTSHENETTKIEKQNYIKNLSDLFKNFKEEFLKIKYIWETNSKIREDLKNNIKDYQNQTNIRTKIYNNKFGKNSGKLHLYFASRYFTNIEKFKLLNLKQKYYINIVKNSYILHKVEKFFNGYNKHKNELKEIEHMLGIKEKIDWEVLDEFLKEFNTTCKRIHAFGATNINNQKKYYKNLVRIKDYKNEYWTNINDYFEMAYENFDEILNEKYNLTEYVEEIKKIKNLENKEHIANHKNYNFIVFNLQILKKLLQCSDLKIKQIENDIGKILNKKDFIFQDNINKTKNYEKQNEDFKEYINKIFTQNQENTQYSYYENDSALKKLELALNENKKAKNKYIEKEIENFKNEYLNVKTSLNDCKKIITDITGYAEKYKKLKNLTQPKMYIEKCLSAQDKMNILNDIQEVYLKILEKCYAIYNASNLLNYYDKHKEETKILINRLKKETNYFGNVDWNDLENMNIQYKRVKEKIHQITVDILNFHKNKEALLSISKMNIFKKEKYKNMESFLQYIKAGEKNQKDIYDQIENIKKYKQEIKQIANINNERYVNDFDNCNFLVIILNIMKNLLECSNLKFTQIKNSVFSENAKLKANIKNKIITSKFEYTNPYENENKEAIETINEMFENSNDVHEYLTFYEKRKLACNKPKNNKQQKDKYLKILESLNKKTKKINDDKEIEIDENSETKIKNINNNTNIKNNKKTQNLNNNKTKKPNLLKKKRRAAMKIEYSEEKETQILNNEKINISNENINKNLKNNELNNSQFNNTFLDYYNHKNIDDNDFYNEFLSYK